MSTRKYTNYLFYFAHDHLDFRHAELFSILDYFNIKATVEKSSKHSPFIIMKLPCEEDAKKIASRSILVRSVFESWVQAETLDKLYTGLQTLPAHFVGPYLQSKESFRYKVSAFNKKLKGKEISQIIEGIPLEFAGPVDLKNPSQSYHILLDYGSSDEDTPEEPTAVHFGRWIADGQRDKIQEYHLKDRKFIANTSMDAQLSMIIANIARVGPNMWVHDPFVGSGGLLVAAAHYGAHVSGTDIDYLLLHAKAAPSRKNQIHREDDESIRANLRQYDREHLYLDVLVADASKHGMWREQTLFDTIITDPPYGVREGAKRTALEQPCNNVKQDNQTADHNSKKEQYHLSDMFRDLLNFAAKYLHKHGRLVYWFPVVRKQYTDDNIPTHPCFRLLYNCEQVMNTKVSRRLITMEKIAELHNCDRDALMKVDHFEKESFRERYFKVESNSVEKVLTNFGVEQDLVQKDVTGINVDTDQTGICNSIDKEVTNSREKSVSQYDGNSGVKHLEINDT